MTPNDFKRLDHALNDIVMHVSVEVMRTPTGELRNVFCDINIHAREIELLLAKAKELTA